MAAGYLYMAMKMVIIYGLVVGDAFVGFQNGSNQCQPLTWSCVCCLAFKRKVSLSEIRPSFGAWRAQFETSVYTAREPR
jgi:hypothetical protein